MFRSDHLQDEVVYEDSLVLIIAVFVKKYRALSKQSIATSYYTNLIKICLPRNVYICTHFYILIHLFNVIEIKNVSFLFWSREGF